MPSALNLPCFTDEITAYQELESILWPDGPICLHCGESVRVNRLKGKATRPGLYKCYACRQQFRVTMNTVFESSHIPLRDWLKTAYLMVSSKKAVSSNQIHRAMGITLKSAWFMTYRIRLAMKDTSDWRADKLGGG